MKNNPIISICIPTYNRDTILRENMERLLVLPSFDDDVELVVSDNASTDSTSSVVHELCVKYPNKSIVYSRNNENIRDRNFLKALSLGRGTYLKLLNDYTSFSDTDLKLMKDEIKRLADTENQSLFFFQDIKKIKKGVNSIRVSDVNQLVRTLNNKMTWISNFGCFRHQLPSLYGFQDRSQLMILQMIWLLYLTETSESTTLVNITSYHCLDIESNKRSPYNFFTPHVVNYYKVLDSYVKRGLISKSTIRKDRSRQLKDFVGRGIKDNLFRKKECSFDLSDSWNIIWHHFSTTPYFYVILLKGVFHATKRHIRNVFHTIVK